jgi:hypothetical protein
MGDDILTHLLVGKFEYPPDSGLTASRWSHNDDSHPLSGGLVELEDLLDLGFYVLKFQLFKSLLYGNRELLISDILRLDAREHVLLKSLVFPRICVSQLGHRVDADGLDQEESFLTIAELLPLLELILTQLASSI